MRPESEANRLRLSQYHNYSNRNSFLQLNIPHTKNVNEQKPRVLILYSPRFHSKDIRQHLRSRNDIPNTVALHIEGFLDIVLLRSSLQNKLPQLTVVEIHNFLNN